MPQDAVTLIFAKAPIAGKVKTRLMPRLNADEAAGLHRYLLLSLLDRLSAAPVAPIELWCSPDTSDAFFQHCEATYGISLHQQQGEDLGARMYHALCTALKRYRRVVLIGADCPQMDNDYIRQAFEGLSKAEVMIGPADDGGYVLFAARQIESSLFEAIPWGSDQVYSLTLERLKKTPLRWHSLSTRRDLDRPEDLAFFSRQLNWP